MEFLTIIIVLALLQLWGSGGSIQRDEWLTILSKRIASFTTDSRFRLGLLVGLPVLLLLIIQVSFESMLFGLLSLLLYIAVLLYSLGRSEFNENVAQYLMHWHNANFQAAYHSASKLGDFQCSEQVDDHIELHDAMRSAFIYEGYQRWFAVVFWFLVLGPVGALAYRITYLASHTALLEGDDKHLAYRATHYIDWLPARLLCLSFCLTGNFVNSFNRFCSIASDNKPVSELLDDCAAAAITGFDEQVVYPTDQEHFIAFGKKQIHALQSLLSRSVICWVMLIAVMQLFVW